MNSLFLLLGDEFRGFVKSKIMIALWVGMPVLAIILHFIQPDTEGIPMTLFTGLFIASIGGLLGAVMLSTSLVNELNANVYDLFLIRPVKRWHILFAKYVAVFLCITLASILSFAAGLVVDAISLGVPAGPAILEVLESLAISLAAISISCVMGILIGILVKSVALAAILSIYLGQQLSVVAILPGILLENIEPLPISLGIGVAVTFIVLFVEIFIFSKKQF
ncbi:MAG: ABC transporter permease [Candidatus Heimdallarchaeota archaeon]